MNPAIAPYAYPNPSLNITLNLAHAFVAKMKLLSVYGVQLVATSASAPTLNETQLLQKGLDPANDAIGFGLTYEGQPDPTMQFNVAQCAADLAPGDPDSVAKVLSDIQFPQGEIPGAILNVPAVAAAVKATFGS